MHPHSEERARVAVPGGIGRAARSRAAGRLTRANKIARSFGAWHDPPVRLSSLPNLWRAGAAVLAVSMVLAGTAADAAREDEGPASLDEMPTASRESVTKLL